MAKRIKIILSRPRNPDNIGACARAMCNFGFHELRLAGVFGPVWDETKSKAETAGSGLPEEKIRAFSKNSAVGAAEIIDKAVVYSSLAEAVGDCSLVIGTSSLHRIKPDREIIDIKEAADYIVKTAGSSNTAIVFGSEKTGLTHEELSFCKTIINIPTSREQPSMNLGQSAAIICHELSALNGIVLKKKAGEEMLPCSRETEGLVKRICLKLRRKFGENWGGEYHERIIRQALLDSAPNRHAAVIIKKLLDL